jgi:putative transposase
MNHSASAQLHRPRLAGQAYDNALAETTIGLYKNECIRADSPFRRGPLRYLADVELITAD